MPTFTFTSPEGTKHSVTGPEGATQEQAFQILQSQLQAKPAAPAPQQAAPATAAPAAPQAQPGFIDRMGQNIQQRVQAVENAPDLINFLASSARLGVGTASDIGGEAMRSGYEALPPEIQQRISGAIPQGVKDYAAGVAERLPTFMQKHPTLSNIAGLAMELPLGAASAKGAGLATKAITKPTAMEAFGKGVTMPRAEKLVEKKNAMTAAANKTIEGAKKNSLTYDSAANLTKDLDSVIDVNNAVAAGASPQTLTQIKNLKTQLGKGDLSAENLIDVRNELSDIRNRGGKDAISAAAAIKKIDAAAKSSGIKDYEAGYKAAAQAKQYNNIVQALDRAGNNAGKLRDEMQSIIDTGKIKTYPQETQKLIRQAASGKVVGNIMQFTTELTKGLPIVGPVARKTLGATAGKIARGTASDVLKSIEKKK